MKRAIKISNIKVDNFLRVLSSKIFNYKQINKHCYLLISIVFFICYTTESIAQGESEFSVGAFLSGYPRQGVLSSYDSSGMNTVNWRAYASTKSFLSNYNVLAFNQTTSFDYINHYATGFYSKWECEQNQLDANRIGVKHIYGQDTTWQGKQCWSTIGLSSPVDSLIYGPHYMQAKEYKRWLYGPSEVEYTAQYRMALDYDPELVGQNDEVCRITVRVRHAVWVNGVYTGYVQDDTLTDPIILKVSDFLSNGNFGNFNLEYTYLPKFPGNYLEDKIQIPIPDNDTTYTDTDGDNGIQFCVEWLGVGTLYVDYVEVYDNFGWNDFIEDTMLVVDRVQNYAEGYLDSNWPNIKYWYANDEPYTIDGYIPMHIVDSLLKDVYAPRLITEFYPSWKVFVNGDSMLAMFNKIAKPEKLMIDYYPFTPSTETQWDRVEAVRKRFAEAHSLQPGFWYVGQGFGIKAPDGSWHIWQKPDSTELKTTIMLALAHGVKGLMFWNYDSYDWTDPYIIDGIVDENGVPTELWYLIKENIVPRLKGVLGNTLLGLDYTGNYLQYIKTPQQSPHPPASNSYLRYR